MAPQSLKSKPKKKSANKQKSVSPLLQGFIWGGCFTLTAAVSGFLGMTVALKSPLPIDMDFFKDKLENLSNIGIQGLFTSKIDEPVNILVMGVDRVPNASNQQAEFKGRSDTMLLVRLNPDNETVKILSIPRDTRVRFPNGRYYKINSANARGGIEYTKGVVSANLNDITIDKHIRITSDAFKQLIDAIGGVEVDVPQDMKYTDKTQGLYIDLKKGQQTLDGDKAEQFARYRNDSLGDIGRIKRQQVLLKALQDKLQSPTSLFKVPKIWGVISAETDSDLTKGELFSIATFALGLEREDIETITLPGRPSTPREYRLSYWLINERQNNIMLKDYIGE